MPRRVPEPKRTRRTFTPEFKAEVVRLVRESRGDIRKVAQDLELALNTVRAWVKQAEVDAKADTEGPLTSEERDELRRLRRENRVLQMERDILKKATAFFAKENT